MVRRIGVPIALWTAAEVVVLVLVAGWIGVGWTLLATLATSVLGAVLVAGQGRRAVAELRERARERRSAGRALGDAGLIAAGGLLMVLPGFLSDMVGLLCLLPLTRFLVRGLVARALVSRLPVALRGPVRVRSARAQAPFGSGSHAWRGGVPPVIEGEVVPREPGPGDRT